MTDSNLPPAPPPPPGAYNGGAQPMSPQDEKTWATLTHIGGIFFLFVPSLIVYLVCKDRGPFIRQHSRAALNFQITAGIALIASWIVGTILLLVVIGFVFYLLALVVSILLVIFSIMAAVAANRGEYYNYPLAINFIK